MTKKNILFSVILLFFVALSLISLSFFSIYQNVKTTCLLAINEYQKDCLDSLIEYIKSEKQTIRGKNTAIWALGQIADKKALPFLYELDKSVPKREKCRYDDYLCKYEIQKAIKWCENGNLTRWMYIPFLLVPT